MQLNSQGVLSMETKVDKKRLITVSAKSTSIYKRSKYNVSVPYVDVYNRNE